jgi:hypothetical protein
VLGAYCGDFGYEGDVFFFKKEEGFAGVGVQVVKFVLKTGMNVRDLTETFVNAFLLFVDVNGSLIFTLRVLMSATLVSCYLP